MKALLGIAGGFVLTLAVFASGLAFATWLLAAKPVRQATPAIGVSELWTKDAQPVDPQKQNLERIPAQQAAAAPAKAGEPAKADGGTQPTALAAPAPPAAPRLQPLPGVPGPGQPAPPDAGAAQQPAAADQQARQQQLPVAHLQWCAARYRSYRPAENSYRSYSGELRPCISPYYDPGSDRTASTGGGQNDQAAANDPQGGPSDNRMSDGQMSDDQAEMEGYAPSGDGYATTYGGPPEEISPEAEAAQAAGRPVSGDHVDYCFNRYRSYDPRDNTYQPFDGGPRRQCE
ncbi:BA14K family protein [Mesorhizobium sp. VK25A]|uniref:Lectin-like protein BA14k n=1 Tax=Mesorhizobium vachelliae TaxID=3072309 RepID=A0ABU5AAF9_9HYPH|nr:MULTISPECIES: BA14K family protein [unclassified Mesorhizobium]MDX8534695.1 BA14K family protein [Mesorhizobium sp. VK25D]MDX8547422.1 BA14K family protein [Mesorhizobium sp. VK25A]